MKPSRGLAVGSIIASVFFWGLAFADAPTAPVAVDLTTDRVVDSVVVGGIGDQGTPRLMDVVTGDVNGDGLADMLFGAPGSSPNGRTGAGSAYLILGKNTLLSRSALDPTLTDNWDLRIDGSITGGQVGFRVALADYDGDGLADIVLTAPGEGSLYLIKGKETFEEKTVLLESGDGFDLAIRAPNPDSLMGSTLCVGDLDGDKRTDLVFSALSHDDYGQLTSTDLYVVPGRESWREKLVALNGKIPRRVRLMRRASGTRRIVHQCAVGDLDNNGAGDIVAAMPFDSVDDQLEAGTIAVVTDVLADSTVVDLGESGAPWGFRIKGSQGGARFGSTVGIADVNGDGLLDLVASAPERLTTGPASEGAMYVFLGGLLPTGSALQDANLTVIGTGGGYGTHLDLVDVNGDSRTDIVVGAPNATTWGGQNTGLLDVFLSGPQLAPPNAEVRTLEYDLRLVGGLDDRLGWSVAAADLNGDSRQDLVIRAAQNTISTRRESGRLVVVSDVMANGRDASIEDIGHMTIPGPGQGGGIARNILQRDLDGDGVLDLVFLSPGGDGTGGVACVVNAGIRGRLDLSNPDVCDLRIRGPRGASLASLDVGDFDGDDRLDLVVGSPDLRHDDFEGMVAVVALPDELTGELVIPHPADVKSKKRGKKKGKKSAESRAKTIDARIWLGDASSGGIGNHVRLHDIDLDGLDEVVAGSSTAGYDDRRGAGVVLVIRGSELSAGTRSTLHPSVTHRFEGLDNSALGSSFDIVNFDGSELPDLVMVAKYATTSTWNSAGSAWVVYDIASLSPGTWNVSDPDLESLKINGSGVGAGLSLEQVVDLDGNGVDDLILLSPYRRLSPREHGSIQVLLGTDGSPQTGTLELSTDNPGMLVIDPRRGERLTSASAGDIDGDGRIELVVSSSPSRRELDRKVYVIDLPDAAVTLVDLDEQLHVSMLVSGGSGAGDLLVATPLVDTDGNKRAEIWLVDAHADDAAIDQGKAYRLSGDETVAAQ